MPALMPLPLMGRGWGRGDGGDPLNISGEATPTQPSPIEGEGFDGPAL